MSRSPALRPSFVVLVSLALGACSGGDGSEKTDGASEGACASDTKAEPYSAGMSKTAASGMTVAITNANPAPPRKGPENVWTLDVKDSSGAPIAGATVAVTCLMTHAAVPSHGCPVDPEVADKGNGTYEVTALYFNMIGHWDVTIDVTPASGQMESVTFPMCFE